jgi:hypothetical protein
MNKTDDDAQNAKITDFVEQFYKYRREIKLDYEDEAFERMIINTYGNQNSN